MTRRKPRGVVYVVARAPHGGAKLIHRVTTTASAKTACGRSLDRWSVAYMRGGLADPLTVLQCRNKACRHAESAPTRRAAA